MRNWGAHEVACSENFDLEIDECIEEDIYRLNIHTKYWYITSIINSFKTIIDIRNFFVNTTDSKNYEYLEVQTETGSLKIHKDDKYKDRYFIDLEKENDLIKLSLFDTNQEFTALLREVTKGR